MPLPLTELSATTQKRFFPPLKDQIFKSNILFKRLFEKARGETVSGESCIEPLEYGKNTSVGSYGDSATFGNTASTIISGATFDWKRYHLDIVIEGILKYQNAGTAKIIDIIAAKMKNGAKSLADKMGDHLFGNAADANDIIGLQKLTAQTGSYGNIDRGSYSWWKAQFQSGVGALTLKVLRTMWNLCKVDLDKPTLIMTTDDLFSAYEGLLIRDKRYQNITLADGSFEALKFKGAFILSDSHCNSGEMHFLNEDYLHVHTLRPFEQTGWQKPINQDLLINHILWGGAFTSSNCSRQGILTGVTVPA